MTRALLTVVMAGFILSCGHIAKAAASPTAVTKLDNGMRMIVREDHSTDLVALDIWVKAGTINETIENSGVSHFIEHLLFKATEKRGPGQIDMEIESLGASAEARTHRDWAHFYTTVASRYLDRTLDVLADALTNPRFRPEDIAHERVIILDEIARKKSQPFFRLMDEVFAAAYTVHPYALPFEGTPESIEKIDRKLIVDYYGRLYTPENTTVVLVGDVNPLTAAAALNKAFADYGKGGEGKVVAPPVEPIRTEPVRKTVKLGTKLSYLAIAFPGPSAGDIQEVAAMDVLMSYLGIGYQGWLSTALRDSYKLAMDVETDFLTSKDPGLAIISISAEPANIERAEEAIMKKVAELSTTPINDADLSRAKRSLEGSHAFETETFGGQANELGFYDAIGGYSLAENYVSLIRDVTALNVQAIAKKYLDPTQVVIVEMGP